MSGTPDVEKPAENDPTVALAGAIVGAVNSAAALLRRFRSEKGMSQADMAARMDVSQPRIAQLESGKPGNAPSLEQLAEFAFHAGRTVALRDAAELAAAEQERAALVRQAQSHAAQVEKQQKQITEQRKRIDALEKSVGWAVISSRTAGKAAAGAAAQGGLLSMLGSHMLAADPEPYLDTDFLNQPLTMLEITKLVDALQTCTQKGTTRVDAVVDAVSDVLQHHVGATRTYDR